MTWFILEDNRTPRPPGTVVLDDIKKNAVVIDTEEHHFSHLKKHKNVVLQPQPSDSPNDPLNWPYKRKVIVIFTLITTGVTVGGMMGMLGTAARQLSEKYHITYPQFVATLTPPAVVSNAIALFLAGAIAAVFGKRIGLVVGAFVLWIVMFSGFFANSIIYYRNLGIVSSIFAAPGELLLGPIITDLIFVHQRGRLMAFAAIVGVVGSDISHVIAGNIIAKLGVKYLYIVSFAVMTPFLVAIYWFVWETTYERPYVPIEPADDIRVEVPRPPTPGSPDSKQFLKEAAVERLSTDEADLKPQNTAMPDATNSAWTSSNSDDVEGTTSTESPHSLWHQLQVFRGRVSQRSFWLALVQPFPLFAFPAVVFSCVINGAYVTWSVMSSIISFQILLYPPYNLQPDKLAYLGLPGSAVSLLSAVVAGFWSDRLIQWMARRNNGIYEPEYRLITLIPAVIFSTIGFLLLGPLYEQKAALWKLVLTSLCFNIATPFASSAAVTYIFDTMQNSTTEAFVATSLVKHILVFFVTKFVPTWFARVGPVKAYRTLAILNLSFAFLAIPMYIFGKQIRGAVYRNKFLRAAAHATSFGTKKQK